MIEENSNAEETAYKEIEEETGISKKNATLVHSGNPIVIKTEDSEVLVNPILFEVDRVEIRLNWEHSEHKWIQPREFAKFETVPKFEEVLKALKLI